ncbi:MAG: hypothetical protein K0S33_228 [Bacteroidetes bacterium]|jgi:hypothetical protein|nr:hypothetical protein [Bacteroidota bacterium]
MAYLLYNLYPAQLIYNENSRPPYDENGSAGVKI